MKHVQLKKTLSIFALAVFVLSASAQIQRAVASTIKAVVNGAVITDFDIAQRQRLERLLSGGRRTLGSTAALNVLIDDKLKLFEARNRNMTPSDGQIENAIQNMARNAKMDKKRLVSIFSQAGVNIETLKDWLKVQLSWRDLVEARFNTQVHVDEAEIYQMLNDQAKKDGTVQDAIQFDLTRVLFITRAKASSAAKNQRLVEAKRFQSRFASCEKDLEAARNLTDVAVERIGRKSTTDLPEPLAKRLRDTEVNKLTPPIQVGDGYEMVAVCGKKDLGKQATLRTEVQTKLRDEKSKVMERKYISELRATAIIDKR
ncbi:peptidylprolyl isomerase [Cohaesibacter haloalkalitolerans]|uniref:peptidylprolyl isomerase n=1 Tax=Cohaesibacter haloalkalitolerans TaxID=1162980 RepID=UPI0013C42C15|nr:peptidylprolyl isomerase [Cohaesibacter haloalkalitolerans]